MSSQVQSQVHGGDIRCVSCGAAQTPAAIASGACSYCKAVLPHRVAAAKQAEAVKQMMADMNGNGIPDMFEPQVANMQQQMGVGAHMAQSPYAAQSPYVAVNPYAAQPPYAQNLYAANTMQGVQTAARSAVTIVVIMAVVAAVVVVVGAVVALLLIRSA